MPIVPYGAGTFFASSWVCVPVSVVVLNCRDVCILCSFDSGVTSAAVFCTGLDRCGHPECSLASLFGSSLTGLRSCWLFDDGCLERFVTEAICCEFY